LPGVGEELAGGLVDRGGAQQQGRITGP